MGPPHERGGGGVLVDQRDGPRVAVAVDALVCVLVVEFVVAQFGQDFDGLGRVSAGSDHARRHAVLDGLGDLLLRERASGGKTGVIDGAMIDATALSAFRLAEVTKYVTSGMETTISDFFLVMNRDSFDDLSAEQQEIVLEAGSEAAINGNACADATWWGISVSGTCHGVSVTGNTWTFLGNKPSARLMGAKLRR